MILRCVSESLNFYSKLYLSRSDQTSSIVVMTLIKLTWLRLSTIIFWSQILTSSHCSHTVYRFQSLWAKLFFFCPKIQHHVLCLKVGYNKWGATWWQSPYWVGNTVIPTITSTWGTYNDGILCYIAHRPQYNYSMG